MHNISGLINMWNPLSSMQPGRSNNGSWSRAKLLIVRQAEEEIRGGVFYYGGRQRALKAWKEIGWRPLSPSPPFPPPPVPLHNQSRCLEPIDVRVWCMAENSWQQYCWDNAPSINEALHMECSAWSQFSFSRTEWKCKPLKRPSDPLQSLCTLNNGTQSVGTTFERAKHLQEGLHHAQNYSLGLHGSITDSQENKNLNSKKCHICR